MNNVTYLVPRKSPLLISHQSPNYLLGILLYVMFIRSSAICDIFLGVLLCVIFISSAIWEFIRCSATCDIY